MNAEVEWLEVSPGFGSAMPHGSCNARGPHGVVCGGPRRADGSCILGHPAPTGWIDPANAGGLDLVLAALGEL